MVAELPAAEADEAALLRAAYNLKQEETLPEAIAAEAVAAEPGGGPPAVSAEETRA